MKKLLHILAALPKCFFVWRVRYPTLAELDCVIAAACAQDRNIVIVTQDVGFCRGDKLGHGNVLLAQALQRVARRYSTIPVLAQLLVSRAAQEIGVTVAKTTGPPSPDTPHNRSTDEYNTRTVVCAQKRWCEEHGKFPALALAISLPLHMGRVQWTMEKEGFTVVPVPLPSVRSRDYTDEESLYFSVRVSGKYPGGIAILYLRELAARLLFLKRGWM